MYHTTGLHRDQITDLCALIHTETAAARKTWPPSLGLFKSVVIALTYLRRNRVQVESAETYDVSQPTVSRAIAALTPLLAQALRGWVPTAEELDDTGQYIVDGTLLPCWSWAAHPELYSGKHKTTGLNVPLAATLHGELAWVSDPIDGRHHDSYRLQEAGVVMRDWIGDKGYLGNNMITPIRKPPHRELLDWEKTFNTQVNQIRYVIEQVVANFKTWRILHTDYRRPLDTFKTTISAVVGLHFYAVAE